MNLSCVVLAGGVEHRVSGPLPRVLQPLCGEPVVAHVLKAAESLGIQQLTVVSNAIGMADYLGSRAQHIHRDGSRGSGDALWMAKSRIEDHPGDVLVLYGDRPLLKGETLRHLIREGQKNHAACAFLSVWKNKPHGHARVMRDADGVVLQTGRDCEITPKDMRIQEVIAGAYYFQKEMLLAAFEEFKPEHLVQFYVTDIVTWLAKTHRILILPLSDAQEAEGVYSQNDLKLAEAILQTRSPNVSFM